LSRFSVVTWAARLLPGVGALVALVVATPAWAPRIRRSRNEPADVFDPIAYRRTWEDFPGARRRLQERFPELHARAFADSGR
jgi:hypothetical protein